MMDYRDLIKDEFLKRRRKDAFFSETDFAKELALRQNHLSYLLRGERGLSKSKAYRISVLLGLKPHEAEAFRFMVSMQSGRSGHERNLAKQGLTRKHLVVAMANLEKRLNSR